MKIKYTLDSTHGSFVRHNEKHGVECRNSEAEDRCKKQIEEQRPEFTHLPNPLRIDRFCRLPPENASRPPLSLRLFLQYILKEIYPQKKVQSVKPQGQ